MNYWYVVGALAATVFLSVLGGFVVDWALDSMTRAYKRPGRATEEAWGTLVTDVSGFTDMGRVAGWVIGTLERVLYVVAIWQGAFAIIPGWMALKVATKWQAWARILKEADVHERFRGLRIDVIRYISWRLSQRFLLGNLLNVFIAGGIYFTVKAVILAW